MTEKDEEINYHLESVVDLAVGRTIAFKLLVMKLFIFFVIERLIETEAKVLRVIECVTNSPIEIEPGASSEIHKCLFYIKQKISRVRPWKSLRQRAVERNEKLPYQTEHVTLP